MEEKSLAKLVVEFEPTAIATIMIEDMSAPVDVSTELSKLALVQKNILVQMLRKSNFDEDEDTVILHPDFIPLSREYRMLMKDINDMSRGVQEKVMMKKIDVVGELYKKIVKEKTPEEMIKIIKSLENDNKPV